MSDGKNNKKSTSFVKYMPAFVFFAFIGVMLLLFLIMPKADFLVDEKRVPEPAPKFTWQTLKDGEFGDDVEKYLSDHFTGRKFFVGLNAYYNLLSGRGGAQDIYNGADGYLINAPVEMNEDKISKNIERINLFAEKLSVPVHLGIVPSTGYVMEDKLPYVHMPYRDSEILKYAEDHLSPSVDYIDFSKPFIDYGGEDALFYRTDHHWTTAGAYLAYRTLCGSIGLTPLEKEDFTVEAHGGFYGTTYSQSGYWLTEPDTVEIWKRNSQAAITVYVEEGTKNAKERDSLYFTEHLEEADKYPVFLDGNHAYTRIVNENAAGGHLLVIKDSYAHCLVPFLTEHYREIEMIDLRYYTKSVLELVQNGADALLILYGIDNFVNDTNFAWLTRGLS